MIVDAFKNINTYHLFDSDSQISFEDIINKLKILLSVLKTKYNNLFIISSWYLTDKNKDIIEKYSKLFNDLKIQNSVCDLKHINYYDIFIEVIYNDNYYFLNKYKSIEEIYNNEEELFCNFELNKKFGIELDETYSFDINFYNKKYHSHLYEILKNQKKYIDILNDKDIVIIDDSLFSNNVNDYIIDLLKQLYRPKSISVITATAKII